MQADIRVSVVICNYNYGHYIKEAIDSVLEQTKAAHQIIVVDDGSTDDSLAKVGDYGGLLQIVAKENGGQISAYNAGFGLVSGDVVVFLDSDDKLLPEALATIAKAFMENGATRVQYKLRLIDRRGVPTGVVIPTKLSSGDRADQVRRGALFLASPGSGNAYLASALRKLMPLPETQEERHGADFFTGYGTALLGAVKALDQVLAEYRVHNQVDSENLCFGNAKLGMTEAEMLQSRFRRFKRWIMERTGQSIDVHAAIADFSIEKQDYAKAIFSPSGYIEGLLGGFKRLPHIMRSIMYRDNSLVMKLGLIAWAVCVLVLPRRIGMPLARYVCNPTSRAG